MSVDDAIRNLTEKGDIACRSAIYEEISRELTYLGLNLAFFVFSTSGNSSCARTLDGSTSSCPALTLYLKYDVDFQQTGIDPHLGNWDDEWAQTRPIRDAVNAILRHHGFGNDYVSDHTFIFVHTLETLAFREIGRQCKGTVKKFVCDAAPGVVITHVFWNGHQYDVIVRDKADYKRVKHDVKAKVSKALAGILAAADDRRHCQCYNAVVKFGYTGMNLFPLFRDDR